MQLPEHGANAHMVYEKLGMTAQETCSTLRKRQSSRAT